MSRKRVKQIGEGKEGEKRGGSKGAVYEPYRERVEALLVENEELPVKQRPIAAKIYEVIREEGYEGCASRIRKRWKQPQEVYVP